MQVRDTEMWKDDTFRYEMAWQALYMLRSAARNATIARESTAENLLVWQAGRILTGRTR